MTQWPNVSNLILLAILLLSPVSANQLNSLVMWLPPLMGVISLNPCSRMSELSCRLMVLHMGMHSLYYDRINVLVFMLTRNLASDAATGFCVVGGKSGEC